MSAGISGCQKSAPSVNQMGSYLEKFGHLVPQFEEEGSVLLALLRPATARVESNSNTSYEDLKSHDWRHFGMSPNLNQMMSNIGQFLHILRDNEGD